jgi:hypothetical protein
MAGRWEAAVCGFLQVLFVASSTVWSTSTLSLVGVPAEDNVSFILLTARY